MEPRSKKARLGEVSEDAEVQALDARTPMSTKTATTFWLGVFESFCVEKEIVLDLKSCSASELDEVLGKFDLGLRMKNGERNRKVSYLAARAAISLGTWPSTSASLLETFFVKRNFSVPTTSSGWRTEASESERRGESRGAQGSHHS